MKEKIYLFLLAIAFVCFGSKVMAAPPDWVPVQNQQYNMQVLATLQIADGVFSENPNDLIAGFVNGECRGVASPLGGEFFGDYIFLTITSDVQSGETITFMAYLADSDKIVELNESFPFVNQGEVGAFGNPFVFTFTEVEPPKITVTLGTGTLSNTTTGPPTPYGTYFKNHRQQYLIFATELTALGLAAGEISALAFNVANMNNCIAMPNYRMKLKQTNVNEFTTAFDNGEYVQVWFHENFLPVSGWNTHEFQTPFVWDGVSNIIVDVCFDLIPDYTQNASVFYTATTGLFTSLRYQNDTQVACGTSNAGTRTINRANMQITGVPVSCPPVAQLFADNLTHSSAHLNWVENGEATMWEIEYGVMPFTLGEGTVVQASEIPFILGGLSESTLYGFAVRALCGGDDNSIWSNIAQFTTLASCPAPTNFQVLSATHNSVQLDWTVVGTPPVGWAIIYGEHPLTDLMEGSIVPALEHPFTVESLLSNTKYDFYVYAMCSTTEVSVPTGPITYTTPCAPADVPFFEGFEFGYGHNTVVAGCWSQQSITGTARWMANNTLTTYNRTPRSGSWNAFLQWSNEDWLFYPMNLNGGTCYTFEMYARQDNANSEHANITVAYGNAGNAGEMINIIVPQTGITSGDYQLITGMFTPPTAGTYYIGIKGWMSGTPFYISIDDISVMECPECPVPSQLSASNITKYEADLNWVENGSASTWNIEYGQQGFTQGEGVIVFADEKPYTISGLVNGTTYEFYVQSICGTETSSWAGPFSFTTKVATLTAVPANLNFGYVASGNSSVLSYELSGAFLGSYPGVISVTAPANFQISFSADNDFSDVLQVPYESETLEPVQIFVKFMPVGEPAAYDANIMHGASDVNLFVNVKGTSMLQYCIPTATSDDATGITQVIFNTIDNTTVGNPAYSDYRTISTEVNKGDTYDLSVYVNTAGNFTVRTRAWIDWNQNGEFEADEVYILGSVSNQPNGLTPNSPLAIEIPHSALEGTTVMRIRATYSVEPTPCGNQNWSEAEDYTLIVLPATGCPKPTNLSVSNITEFTADLSWVENGDATSWNIEYGPQGFDIGTGTNIYNITDNPFTLIGPQPGTAYSVYVQSICGGDVSAWEGPVHFTTIASCLQPTDLTSANITENSAEISWIETVITTSSWNIEYGLSGFALGTGSLLGGVSDNPYLLEGLQSSTEYDVYVQSICNGETSAWTGPHTFMTACGVFTLPFFEDFETSTVTCWSQQNLDGGGQQWSLTSQINHTPNGSMSAVHFYGSPGYDEDGLLISPSIYLPENQNIELSFWSYNDWAMYYGRNSVHISTDAGENYQEIWFAQSVVASWVETSLDLSEFAGETILIGFRYEGNDGHSWILDDVKVEVVDIPVEVTCPNDFEICQNIGSITLIGATPEGGEYTGPFVDNGLFNTDVATLGAHLIVYTYNGETCQFTISVKPVFEIDIFETICQGDEFYFGNLVLTSGGLYEQTFQATNGCDSVVTLNLTVNPTYSTFIDDEICEGEEFVFGSQTLTASGQYEEVFQAVNGCDSIVTLSLTVHPAYTNSIAETICQGEEFIFGTQTLTETGDYVEVFQTVFGCDSTVTLNLTVNPIFEVTDAVAICEGDEYYFGNLVLTTAGEYVHTFMSYLGCDSTVTLNLTVNPTFEVSDAVAICEGDEYYFGNLVLTTAGEYVHTFMSYHGCDSTVTLTLTVNPSYYEFIEAEICEGEVYEFAGQTITTQGSYFDQGVTEFGCTSIVELWLTVHPTYTNSIAETICQGEEFIFGTQTLTVTGEYVEVFQTVFGCDSTVTLNLTVNPTFEVSDAVAICEGDEYYFGNLMLTTAGEYVHTFMSYHGCDSTVTLTLTVNPTYYEFIEAEICEGDEYEFAGQILTTQGSYFDQGVTEFGCTSIVELWLTVNPLPEIICPNDMNVDINGQAIELIGTPEGGIFNGNGVAGNIFNPSVAGLGQHNITYTYQDAITLCTNTCSFTINVYEDALSSEADILSFSFNEQLQAAVIDNVNKTVHIEVVFETDIGALVPTIQVSEGASINPGSGVVQNFSTPFTYIVTAEDGTEVEWTVFVTVHPFYVNVTQNIGTSAMLHWPTVSGAVSYIVHFREANTNNPWKQGFTNTNSRRLTSLLPGQNYEVRILVYGAGNTYLTYYHMYYFTAAVIDIVATQNMGTALLLSWNDIEGFDQYIVQYRQSTAASWKISAFTNTNSIRLWQLVPGEDYECRVLGYANGVYGGFASDNFTSANIQFEVIENTGVSARITWINQVPDANRFVLHYRIAGSLDNWLHANTLTDSRLLVNLLPNTTYEYRLLGYFNNIYGGVSPIHEFTTIGGKSNTNTLVTDQNIEMNVYPNPFVDIITVEIFTSIEETVLYTMYDITGKVIMSGKEIINTGYNTLTVQTEYLSAGIYILNVVTDNETHTFRVVK